MGLQGMINDLVEKSDFITPLVYANGLAQSVREKDAMAIAQAISCAERGDTDQIAFTTGGKRSPVLGITGTGGAGKSSLTDEIVRRFLLDHPDKTLSLIHISEPTRPY